MTRARSLASAAACLALTVSPWLPWYRGVLPDGQSIWFDGFDLRPASSRLLLLGGAVALLTHAAPRRRWAVAVRVFAALFGAVVALGSVARLPVPDGNVVIYGVGIGAALGLVTGAGVCVDALAEWWGWRPRLGALLVAGSLVFAAFALTWTDRINVGNGFGGDGATYGLVALDFPGVVFGHEQIATQTQKGGGVDQYYIQKVLPSGIVWLEQRLLGISPTVPNVIHSFALLDVALVGLLALLWVTTGRRLGLTERGVLLGTVALLGNYLVLKNIWYYPVTTDLAGYAVAAAALLFFLSRRPIALAATTVAGAFCYPSALYVGAALLLFPAGSAAREGARPLLKARTAILLAIGVFVALMVRLVTLDRPSLKPLRETHLDRLEWLAAIVVIAYLIGGLGVLLSTVPFRVADVFRSLRAGRVVGVVVMVVGVRVAQELISVHGRGLGEYEPFSMLAWRGVAGPGLFLVTAVTYWGPLLVVAPFVWRRACRLIGRQGPGLTAVAALAVVTALSTEARNLLGVLPIVLPFVVCAAVPEAWSPRRLALFAALAVAMSKVWLWIGPIDPVRSLEFPSQRYYIAGPFMSEASFWVQLALLALCAVVVYALLPRAARPGAAVATR